jgi:hypothetical protein
MRIYLGNNFHFILFTLYQNCVTEKYYIPFEVGSLLAESLRKQGEVGKQPEDKYERHQTDEILCEMVLLEENT